MRKALAVRIYIALSEATQFGYYLATDAPTADDISGLARLFASRFVKTYELPEQMQADLELHIKTAFELPTPEQHGVRNPDTLTQSERMALALEMGHTLGSVYEQQPTELSLLAALIIEVCKIDDATLMANRHLFTEISDNIQMSYEELAEHSKDSPEPKE